jgi:hypothetical protein
LQARDLGSKFHELGGDPITVTLADPPDLHVHHGCRLVAIKAEPLAKWRYRLFGGAGTLDYLENLTPLSLPTRDRGHDVFALPRLVQTPLR